MGKSGECLIFLLMKHPEIQLDEEDVLTYGRKFAVFNKGYVDIRRNNTTVGLHRLLLGEPEGDVDHIDGNRANNKKENLRTCTRTENCHNRKTVSNSTSGYKGVAFIAATGKYNVSIKSPKGARYFLGTFSDPKLGALAYNEAASKLFGEFACLNKIEGYP